MSDFHELLLTCLTVQTLFILDLAKDGSLALSDWRKCAGTGWIINVGDAFWILKNTCHLFEQNSVFSFDLSVPLYC